MDAGRIIVSFPKGENQQPQQQLFGQPSWFSRLLLTYDTLEALLHLSKTMQGVPTPPCPFRDQQYIHPQGARQKRAGQQRDNGQANGTL